MSRGNKLHLPHITVIVPVLNGEKVIGSCIKSLLNLDYPSQKLEIIVVDNNSTDRTAKIIKSLPVKYIFEEKIGISAARNAGIKQAKGEIIVFTDSDCLVNKNWLKEHVKSHVDKSIAAVGGFVKDKKSENIYERWSEKTYFVSPIEDFVDSIIGCNMSFRAGFLKGHFFDENIVYGADESDLCQRVLKAGFKIYYNPKAIVLHKHRSTLLAIIKKYFRLGKGEIYFRKKHELEINYFRIILLSLCVFFFVLSIFGKFFLLFFFVFFLYFLYKIFFYGIRSAPKSFKEKIIIFPIEFFASTSYLLGQIWVLMRTTIPKLVF